MNNPVDAMMDTVDWQPVEMQNVQPGELYATHQGVLTIGDLALRCYQLSDGQRVIDADDVQRLFGVVVDGI